MPRCALAALGAALTALRTSCANTQNPGMSRENWRIHAQDLRIAAQLLRRINSPGTANGTCPCTWPTLSHGGIRNGELDFRIACNELRPKTHSSQWTEWSKPKFLGRFTSRVVLVRNIPNHSPASRHAEKNRQQ